MDKTPIYMTTYERREYFSRTMRSILRSDLSRGKLHVIDDCSKDPMKLLTLDAWRYMHVDIDILPQNIRTKHMFMEVLRRSGDSEYTVIVQDDVIFHPEWLNVLLDTAPKIPKLGILTPWDRKLTTFDGKWQLRGGCILGGVCWLVSKGFKEDILANVEVVEGDHYDSYFQSLAHHFGYKLAVTVPSYVQHIGEKSIVRPGELRIGGGYVADNFIGESHE